MSGKKVTTPPEASGDSQPQLIQVATNQTTPEPSEASVAVPQPQPELEPEPELVEVLVLRDEPAFSLKCGQVLLLDAATARQLKKAGGVDDTPAAVGAAKAAQPHADADDVIED
ncbi:hypothetical protein GFK99_22020 [Pseudomonas stutzeri]|nr:MULTISPECIES: hypothetical protein [Pseudomonadaceae]MBK3797532.1 hypothetical protein [Stutzerimonas stutzeri]MBK3876371.1 hypothetical protein [Stutzerimonas stutzeri]